MINLYLILGKTEMEESAVETEAPRQGERTGSTLPAKYVVIIYTL